MENTTVPETSPIAGLRLLVVEDEMLLALSLEDSLRLLGCEVVKAARLKSAVVAAESEALDGALLDVNLAGERVYPVAEALAARGVPFAFMTGYHEGGIDKPWNDRPSLSKPFTLETLEAVAAATFRHRHSPRRRGIQ